MLRSEKDQYYQVYSLVGDQLAASRPGLAAHVQEDAYRQKVLSTFLGQGRLIGIPAHLKQRQIILEKLVQEVQPDRTYTEREANQVLAGFCDDVATLRREMIGHGLMDREGGVYRRVAPPAAP